MRTKLRSAVLGYLESRYAKPYYGMNSFNKVRTRLKLDLKYET